MQCMIYQITDYIKCTVPLTIISPHIIILYMDWQITSIIMYKLYIICDTPPYC